MAIFVVFLSHRQLCKKLKIIMKKLSNETYIYIIYTSPIYTFK